MKRFLLLMLGLYAYCLYAQPVITDAIIPEPGDSIHLIRCNETDPLDNLTGASQTWDFSGLTQQSVMGNYYFNWHEPDDTPHGDRYPNASLAASTPDSQYIYYTYDGATLELVGAVAPVSGFGTAFGDYANYETETVFPLELGTTWSDEFDGTNVAGSFSAPFNGTVTGEVDGYGTLILPTGTYHNVVRNRQERTYQIQGVPLAESSTLWVYSAADVGLWLLSIEDIDGGDQLVYYSESPQIINHSGEVLTDNFSFYPNPAKAGQTIFFEGENEGVQQIELCNSMGEILVMKSLKERNFELPDNLPNGIYLVRMKNQNGSFYIKKITVH